MRHNRVADTSGSHRPGDRYSQAHSLGENRSLGSLELALQACVDYYQGVISSLRMNEPLLLVEALGVLARFTDLANLESPLKSGQLIPQLALVRSGNWQCVMNSLGLANFPLKDSSLI